MKKIIKILLIISLISVIGFSAENEEFSILKYKPSSTQKYAISTKKISDTFSIPVIEGDEIASRKMNRYIATFQAQYLKPQNQVKFEVLTNNNNLISILYEIKSNDQVSFYTHNFNVKNGTLLNLSDLFVPGYNKSLTDVIVAKAREMGLNVPAGYKESQDKDKFFISDDVIIFVYNQKELSDSGDQTAFVPFHIEELTGIIK